MSWDLRLPAVSVVIIALTWAVSARAASITVNQGADTTPGYAGSGTVCSLRMAVEKANGGSNTCNKTGTGAVTITLPAAKSPFTLVPANLWLSVSQSMTITGDTNNYTSSVVNGGGSYQIFQIASGSGADLQLKKLKLTNGKDLDAYGGALLIPSGASAELTTVWIYDCKAWLGGGIYNAGSLTITSSKLEADVAVYGGGLYLDSSSTTTITSTTVTGNLANQGGGGTGSGGGIYANGSTLRDVTKSTFSSNIAYSATGTDSAGGAIYLSGQLALNLGSPTNSFTSNSCNHSSGGTCNGGAIYSPGIGADQLDIYSPTTFTSNTASNGGAVYFGTNTSSNQTSIATQTNLQGTTTNTDTCTAGLTHILKGYCGNPCGDCKTANDAGADSGTLGACPP